MEMYEPPFNITNKMLNLVSTISSKLEKIDSYKNLSRMPILRRNNKIESIHASLAIEANSLTIGQVRDVINGKLVLGEQREIQEVKNAFAAYERVIDTDPYSMEKLKEMHGVMTFALVNESGKFRRGNEGVFDGDRCIFIAPPPNMVESLMESLFEWIKSNKDDVHPLILSSVFHYEFVFIHPFSDGNGRMARLWQNCILSKWKEIFEYMPIETQIKKYQQEYYEAISKSHISGNCNEFIEFMLKMIDGTLDELLINTNKEIKQTSMYVEKILSVMSFDSYYSANELMGLLGIKSKENLRANYLDPAIANGLIKLTMPDKPTSKNQKYYKVG